MDRLLLWRGLDEWRAESAHVIIDGDRMTATGTQLGVNPEPYRLDYTLRTGSEFVTDTLELSVLQTGALKRLLLVRRPDGSWTGDDRELPEMQGALDCDIQNCPLTNTMPVLRHGLLAPGAKPHRYVMAWVAVPDLTVHRSDQWYEPIDARHVRYVGVATNFVAELEYDEDGLVLNYPDMAAAASVKGLTP
jgi:uncharacterized protein